MQRKARHCAQKTQKLNSRLASAPFSILTLLDVAGLACGRLQHKRLFRHYNPAHRVSDDSNQPKKRADKPDNAYEGNIHIEVFSEARADAGNFACLARAYQPFARDHAGHALSAIGAKLRIILNDLATIVAVHRVPLSG